MTDGTNRDFFCPMQQLNFEDVTLILHSRPRRAGLDWMKDDFRDLITLLQNEVTPVNI